MVVRVKCELLVPKSWARCLISASMTNVRANRMRVPRGLQVIPAENLVAAFSGSDAQLLAATPTCEDACTMLGALEVAYALPFPYPL